MSRSLPESNDENTIPLQWTSQAREIHTRAEIRFAKEKDLSIIKQLADAHRNELGFTVRPILEERMHQRMLFVCEDQGIIVGFVGFHHRRDGWTTIHEICVEKEFRGRGLGRRLVEAVEEHARQVGQCGVRLKCPLDLPANGFYAQLGFIRVAIEKGRSRPLAVWEKSLPASTQPLKSLFPTFFATLTHQPGAIRNIIRLWDESGDERDPFAHVIFTPLFSNLGTIKLIQSLKDERGSEVMFDSGGYQVQMGKIGYEELFERLLKFYRENNWADWYVLPDHVPCSSDEDREVENKVRESLDFARLFLKMMPESFTERAIGVVHGRTEEQICRCIEAYAEMGLRYIGFGSFGTSGPNGTVNLVSQRSLRLLSLVLKLIWEYPLNLHIFGIGSPSPLLRFADAGIIPTSFDSAGWWKAGGFGNIFFPKGRQLHITAMPTIETTPLYLERQKKRSGHQCRFCDNLQQLRHSRMKRIMHNLAAMMDTIEQIKEKQSEIIVPYPTKRYPRSIELNPKRRSEWEC